METCTLHVFLLLFQLILIILNMEGRCAQIVEETSFATVPFPINRTICSRGFLRKKDACEIIYAPLPIWMSCGDRTSANLFGYGDDLGGGTTR